LADQENLAMKPVRLLSLAAAAALALTACEARFGNDAEAVPSNGSAENKAEEGRVSVRAPGFDLKISIPEGIRREANMEGDNDIIYPNSTMSGIHVEAGRDSGDRPDEVELAFTTADTMEQVVAWYRAPARASDFRLGGVGASGREGGHNPVIFGTTRENDEFQISLSRRPGGGTEARLLIRDRN